MCVSVAAAASGGCGNDTAIRIGAFQLLRSLARGIRAEYRNDWRNILILMLNHSNHWHGGNALPMWRDAPLEALGSRRCFPSPGYGREY